MFSEDKKRLLKKILIIVAIPIVLILIFAIYNIFIPPFGEMPKVEEVKIEKIPDEENAWYEYKLAIKDLNPDSNPQKITEEINKEFPNIKDVSKGFAELEEKNTAYLDKHLGAINHIVTGSNLPKAQFQAEIPNILKMKIPDISQCMALTNLTTAQARRLVNEGKLIEAAQMNLTAFKMATDFSAETYASLISSVITMQCRDQVAGALLYLINQEKIEATTLATIAKGVQTQEPRLLSPYKYQSNEWLAIQNSMNDFLLKNKFTSSENENYPYALRARIYQHTIPLGNKLLELKRPALEKWDFKALEQAEQEQEKLLSNPPWNVGGYISTVLVSTSIASIQGILKNDYLSRVMTQTVEINAACLAYKKTHNKFPDTLETAFSELGLKVPIDPTTAKPVNYRLEGDKAVIWFAGVDGKDDGGKQAYLGSERKSPKDGKDYIFTIGEMPDWFKQ